MTIKFLKGIGIFIFIAAILYVFIMIVGLIAFNRLKTDSGSKTTYRHKKKLKTMQNKY